jgi:hypothetical protein
MPKVIMAGVLLLVFAGNARAADGIQSIGSCRTIDKPGSYMLAKDLAARGTCLLITTSFVTIDLAGYTIVGDGTGVGISNGSGGLATDGIGPFDITVRNGTVTNFEHGVHLDGRGHVVEGVRAVDNRGVGIHLISASNRVPGDGVLRNNVASRNGLVGLRAVQNGFPAGGFSVIGNVANSNGVGAAGSGIIVSCPSSVINNAASGNGNGGPLFDIGADPGCTRLGNAPAP